MIQPPKEKLRLRDFTQTFDPLLADDIKFRTPVKIHKEMFNKKYTYVPKRLYVSPLCTLNHGTEKKRTVTQNS